MGSAWTNCLQILEREISDPDYNAWIRPLHVNESEKSIELLAPNTFIQNHVEEKYLSTIESILAHSENNSYALSIRVINHQTTRLSKDNAPLQRKAPLNSNLNPFNTFDNFVDSESTQLAYAAGNHVAQSPGGDYNPLFIYGGTGLGKTHLMHAIGHKLLQRDPDARVYYVRSERFVSDFITSLRSKTMDQFKQFYQSIDALLIDDIQFFANKTSSQEEFLSTYNLLLDSNKQIVLTSDRFPKEIDVDQRLKSRFGGGMSLSVQPPEEKTRISILMKKAELTGLNLPKDVAKMVASTVKSNVRELEGALNNIRAQNQITGKPITLEDARNSLSDLIAIQNRMVSIENIQQTVAQHYQVSLSDLLSSSRSRSLARPRQIAMSLARELTEKSLPEIAKAFGRKDHTTVLYANRKIEEIRKKDSRMSAEYLELRRMFR